MQYSEANRWEILIHKIEVLLENNWICWDSFFKFLE